MLVKHFSNVLRVNAMIKRAIDVIDLLLGTVIALSVVVIIGIGSFIYVIDDLGSDVQDCKEQLGAWGHEYIENE